MTASTTLTRTTPSPRRVRLFVVSTVIYTAAALGVWTFRQPLFFENFAVVDHGRVFRSAQPYANLGRWIDDHGIATILNLRGGTRWDAFYRDEAAVAEARGVTLFDLPMRAEKRPPRAQLLRLIDVLETAKYPLLIHCKQGADRTGLASTLYRMMQLGEPPQQAATSFTVEHGHVPLFGTQRLHEPIDEYTAWLALRGLAHTPARFRNWVETLYRDPGETGAQARADDTETR